ncbi:Glucomannan 4-beta-mannosyltransferase 9 [Quillaja saponaria]|uniref:Glucomannan 4-beta-mannosyltransferase 9 n=1 Tax=Quillaja saponaria TaxID=32244 RepID=A0AAD7M636_QUISA|nr:Glucomannan 4-beta-mannosyltransferase 9 [Quillaja saponaria]
MQETVKQRHKHEVANQGQQKWVQSRGSQRRHEAQLRQTVNANECLMTRMQEMSLAYHFIVEQELGSSTYAFFGFNGQ